MFLLLHTDLFASLSYDIIIYGHGYSIIPRYKFYNMKGLYEVPCVQIRESFLRAKNPYAILTAPIRESFLRPRPLPVDRFCTRFRFRTLMCCWNGTWKSDFV